MGILSNGRLINSARLLETEKQQLTMPKLSKSRFVTGLQCLKALYYSCYRNDLRDRLTEEQKAIFQRGTDIGVEAQKVYPDGVLIRENYKQISEALVHTQEALSGANDIYEAAFEADEIVVRADILHRADDEKWDLIEVKSSMSVKDVNVRDVGIQLYVLEHSGIDVDTAILMHMARGYNYTEPDWSDPTVNFVKADITERAQEFANDIPQHLVEMRDAIADRGTEPPVVSGNQCLLPYRCAFYGHCHPEEVVTN